MDSRWRCCGFRFPLDVIVLAVDEPATRRLAVRVGRTRLGDLILRASGASNMPQVARTQQRRALVEARTAMIRATGGVPLMVEKQAGAGS
jgi:hypothetical protein